MKKFVIMFCALVLGVGVLSAQDETTPLAGGGSCYSNDPSSPVGIVPTFVSGNTPATSATNVKIEPPVDGTYALGTGSVTITFTNGPCGEVMSWSVSSNIVVEHVYAKGGSAYNDYDYTATYPRPTTDGNIHCPIAGGSGTYADFSHVNFVFHYRLDASKTATTEYTRTFDWSIDKSCNGPASLTLSEGQVYSYPFSWTASVAGYTDSDFKVTGTITIANNTPSAATITGISDLLSGGETGNVDCGISFPYVLGSGATLNCTYSANLAAPYSGTNTVTVTTSTPLVEGDEATADFAFGNPTNLVDECVTVSDDCNAPTQVCSDAAPFTKQYTCQIGPYDVCGEYTYTNTASFTTNDQGVTGSDNCTVSVDVPCGGGCTLTQGYWKTHSEFGPAPYDETWAQLPNGASTAFFLSGQTYYQVLWTSPAGNAYYNLAHQYIAAQLNFLNGADPSAAQAAFSAATALLNTYTPAQVAAMKATNAVRKQFIALAATLDSYNNGLIGPGHCSESAAKLGAVDAQSGAAVPAVFNLAQNYPNPFNPSTTLAFDLPQATAVKLTIYNIAGQQVAIVFNGELPAGHHAFTWQPPAHLVSGVYLYKLQTNEFTTVKKMTLQK